MSYDVFGLKTLKDLVIIATEELDYILEMSWVSTYHDFYAKTITKVMPKMKYLEWEVLLSQLMWE